MPAKPKAPVATTAESGAAVPPASPKWTALVEKFATSTGLGIEVVGPRFKTLTGTDDDAGVELLENAIDTPDQDVKALFANEGVAPARLNRAIREMRAAAAPVVPAAPAPGPSGLVPNVGSTPILLTQAPGDDDLLRALRIGGRPEFEAANLAAVIRAAVAAKNGLYGLPKRLQEAIHETARRTKKPAPAVLVEIRRELARRSDQAALFADLMPGQDGANYVTTEDKVQTIKDLDKVWPAFMQFQQQLRGFRDEAVNVAMTAGMMGMQGMNMGLAAAGLTPEMLVGTSLDAQPYVDASEGIINALNEVFADMGLYASRVLAVEAHRLTQIVQKDELIAAVGATNREEMLLTLKIGMTSDVIRAQQNLVTWVVNVIDLPNKDAMSLRGVLLTLFQLGEQIPWEKLSNGAVSLPRQSMGNGANRPSMDGRPLPGQKQPGNTVFGNSRD